MCIGFMRSAHSSWQILIKLEFSPHILKNTQISNFMKIDPKEAMRTDGRTEGRDRQTDRQTDMTKLIFTSRNSVNAPKNLLRTLSRSFTNGKIHDVN